MVHPVGLDDEFLVIHALTGDRHVGGSRLGVLRDEPVVPLGEHAQDLVRRTERVQLGPAVEILERIVRAVVGAPPHEALQVAPGVEVLREEFTAGRHVLGEQLPLKNGPTRRSMRVLMPIVTSRRLAG